MAEVTQVQQGKDYALLVGTGASAAIWALQTDNTVCEWNLATDTFGDPINADIDGGWSYVYDAALDVVWSLQTTGLRKTLAASPYTTTSYAESIAFASRLSVDAAGNLWIKNSTAIERLDKDDPTGVPLEVRDFGVSFGWFHVDSASGKAYAGSITGFTGSQSRIYMHDGVTASYFDLVGDGITTIGVPVYDGDGNSLWCQCRQGSPPVLVEWSIDTDAIVQIIGPDSINPFSSFIVKRDCHVCIYHEVDDVAIYAVDTVTGTDERQVFDPWSDGVYTWGIALAHPNGALYLNGYDAITYDNTLYRYDPALTCEPGGGGGGGASVIQTVLVGQLMKRP